MINVIYGSLATAVVALVFLEIAAINFLFGAQLIAEYERFDIEAAKATECALTDGVVGKNKDE